MYVVQNEHLVQSDVVFLKLLWMQAASKSYHGAPNSHNNLTRNPCLDGDVAQKTWGYQGLSTKRVAYWWRTLSAASTIWGKQHRTDWWGDVDIFMHFSFAMQKLARHYVLYLANYLPVYMNTGSSLTWLMDAILVPHVFHNWRNEYVYVGILNWRQDSSVKPSNFCQHKPNRILNTPLCLSMFGGSVCWVYVRDQIKA